MVDVTHKPVTGRRARAVGSVRMSARARELLLRNELAKGDALAVARLAGIAAAKQTPALIALCHPVAIGAVTVDVLPAPDGVRIEASVATADRTGIEMEALTCVTVAALAIVDMVKAVDRNVTIGEARVVEKTGGRSGDWRLGDDGLLHVAADARPAEAPPAGLADAPPAGLADAPLANRRALVLTVSDRRSAGVAADESGPVALRLLTDLGATGRVEVVPDGIEAVRAAVRAAVKAGIELVVTSGGTGIGPRDLTPEALEPVLERRIPGLEHAIRAASDRPAAALSRAVVGSCDRTVVVALPGSPAAVREGIGALRPVLGHLLDQIGGGDHAAPAAPAVEAAPAAPAAPGPGASS